MENAKKFDYRALAANVNYETMTGGELAMLLVALLLIEEANLRPYPSFVEQLGCSANMGEGPEYERFRNVLILFYETHAHLFTAARDAIGELLVELKNSNQWGNCKLVTQSQIKQICHLL